MITAIFFIIVGMGIAHEYLMHKHGDVIKRSVYEKEQARWNASPEKRLRKEF